MEALSALLDTVSHGLAGAFAAAPLAWALAVAGLLLALVVVAVRLRAGPRNEIDAIYLMSAAATRKAREISELDAFARRVNAASDELKQQIRKLRAGHHTQVKIYIDHSNFITSWNDVVHRGERTQEHDVDWHVLPAVLMEEVEAWLKKMRRAPAAMVYRGMHVYGTLFDDAYFKLLETMLDHEQATPSRLPLPIRLRRETVERWREENAAHKWDLTHEIRNVVGCTVVPVVRRTPKEEQLGSAQYTSGGIPIAPEKTLDTRIATDLIGDATFESYDIAILVTEDSDFIPAVEFVQDMRGKHVVHVGFGSHMNELRSVCRHRIDLGKGALYRRMQRGRARETETGKGAA
ncbi:MAG TPA: NYN domain-containing protein [Hyphomicrobiaceae bacterium]|nr:NYN domain-containing protein [Hyphomicrobiaceae bacterium]